VKTVRQMKRKATSAASIGIAYNVKTLIVITCLSLQVVTMSTNTVTRSMNPATLSTNTATMSTNPIGGPTFEHEYWAGYRMVFRPQMGHVRLFDRSSFPSVDTKSFNHLKTPKDIQDASITLNQKYTLYGTTKVGKRKDNYTLMMVTSDGLDFSFDHKTGGIYLFLEKLHFQVARSIPEFYARIDMELAIDKPFSQELIPIPGTIGSDLFLTGCSGGWYDKESKKLNLKHLWEKEAPKYWTGIQRQYLLPFYQRLLNET
jgi:hypothetical protein